MTTVIELKNISKQYRLGQVGTGTIRNDFKRWMAKVQGKEDPFLKIDWMLKMVSMFGH